MAEAIAKVGAYCREAGRDPAEIRWTGGGSLFMHDDPEVQRQAMQIALQLYGGSEESVRSGLFGSAADVRAGIERQIAAGVTEVIVFQLPRVHAKSLFRFSEEVIPAFQ